jgi:hypothetical protein
MRIAKALGPCLPKPCASCWLPMPLSTLLAAVAPKSSSKLTTAVPAAKPTTTPTPPADASMYGLIALHPGP